MELLTKVNIEKDSRELSLKEKNLYSVLFFTLRRLFRKKKGEALTNMKRHSLNFTDIRN